MEADSGVVLLIYTVPVVNAKRVNSGIMLYVILQSFDLS